MIDDGLDPFTAARLAFSFASRDVDRLEALDGGPAGVVPATQTAPRNVTPTAPSPAALRDPRRAANC